MRYDRSTPQLPIARGIPDGGASSICLLSPVRDLDPARKDLITNYANATNRSVCREGPSLNEPEFLVRTSGGLYRDSTGVPSTNTP